MFGADFIGRDTEWFAGASFHFIQTALNAAQGIRQIVRVQSARFQRASMFADGMFFGFTKSRLHAAKMNSPANRVKWECGRFPGNPFAVAERRPKIAHGETMGINAQTNKAPDEAREVSAGDILPSLFTAP